MEPVSTAIAELVWGIRKMVFSLPEHRSLRNIIIGIIVILAVMLDIVTRSNGRKVKKSRISSN